MNEFTPHNEKLINTVLEAIQSGKNLTLIDQNEKLIDEYRYSPEPTYGQGFKYDHGIILDNGSITVTPDCAKSDFYDILLGDWAGETDRFNHVTFLTVKIEGAEAPIKFDTIKVRKTYEAYHTS